MALDTRNSALFKRAEQLKRWEESDTNKEPAAPKNLSGRKIKFSSGCVFLAACMAGDKDEVLKLLNEGADINTANVDGLTALHQVCIDDNLEMVEFLVQNGADVNRQDNEGWTSLHATASCGFVSIASYLIENGADLSAINSDGDLCIDLASGDMENLLQRHLGEQGIDCEKARQSEQRLMLNDAKKWLRSDATEADRPHPRTGATALHVAAAKGYAKVLGLLLAGRADVDKQDNDGWTPLHAAAHWGQKEAIQMLITSQADMDIKNYAGQTALDIAHPDVIRCLDELKRNTKRPKRKPIPPKIIDSMDNHIERPPKVIRVEVKTDLKDSEDERIKFLDRISESDDTSDSENDTDSTESSHSTSISEDLDEKPKTPNNNNENTAPISSKENKTANDEDAPWRRSSSLRQKTQADSPPKTQVPDKEAQSNENEVILRRTQSFENDDKFYQKYRELQARIKANSCPVLPATQINVVGSVGGGGNANNTTNNYSVQRSASLKDNRQLRIKIPQSWPPTTTTPATTPTTNTTTTTTATPTTPNTAPIRSPNISRTEDFLAKRYGSVQSLPPCGASEQNANDATSKFGGSALNLMAAHNDPFNRVLPPPRQAASISNITNVNENGATPLSDDTRSSNENQEENGAQPPPPPPPPPQQSTLTKLSPGNIFKNFFKSFVPPARDEESETQRKAHAKRVRETRRSTQGVTLDEFKSAEEFVKKKNMNNNVTANSTDPTNDKTPSSLSTTTTTQSSEISDRIPTSNTDDNSQSVTATVITDNKIVNSEPTSVTASYTITTTVKKDNTDIDNKISASYTIVPPNSNNNSNHNKPSPIDESKEYIESSPTITATINVPSNNLTIKTDTDELSSTSSTTTTTTSATQQNNNSNSNNNKLDDNESDTTVVTAPATRYIRDKRSLFDIDNASSLSLAEKLRNEANKYNEVSATSSSSTLDNTSSDNNNDSINKNNNKHDTSLPSSPLHQISAAERRPSWRLKFDAGNKFKLEDATSLQQQQQNSTSTSALPVNNTESSSTTSNTTTTATVTQRRPNNLAGNLTATAAATQRPVSAPVISAVINSDEKLKGANISNDVTYKRIKNEEDKENDKEHDTRSAQATQAVIQRRRRPKRRSTGVVRLDKDELDPDRQESPTDGEEKEKSYYRYYRNSDSTNMSFRSRSRNIQPITTRPRSHSSSRIGNGNGSNSFLTTSSPSYTASAVRPITSPSYYTNPATSGYNPYGSNNSLYSPTGRNGFFNSTRDPYGSTTSLNIGKTPSNYKYGGSVNSIYASPYNSDRYYSPYSTHFDNGVMTASLNLSVNPIKSSTPSSSYTPKSYSNGATQSSRIRDYTPIRNSSNLIPSKEYSGSNQSLNSYSTAAAANTHIPVGRSQSLREQERKSRTRNRRGKQNDEGGNNKDCSSKRSLSVSSEKSEGYESGSEISSRSRLDSTNSAAAGTESHTNNNESGDADSTENGEFIDYKALWEASKVENDKLKVQLKKKDEELFTVKSTLDRFTNATSKNSLSEIEKRERRAMERKMSEMEEELKQYDALKTENQRLKDENGALIRVISKLSK